MNNLNVEVNYGEAKNCASRLIDNIIKMRHILDKLSENVNSMTWSGSSASSFKTAINRKKEELDIIYNNYISKLPSTIDQSITNYQKYES